MEITNTVQCTHPVNGTKELIQDFWHLLYLKMTITNAYQKRLKISKQHIIIAKPAGSDLFSTKENRYRRTCFTHTTARPEIQTCVLCGNQTRNTQCSCQSFSHCTKRALVDRLDTMIDVKISLYLLVYLAQLIIKTMSKGILMA